MKNIIKKKTHLKYPKIAPVQMHKKSQISTISSVFCIMFKHTSTILTNIINAAFKELRYRFAAP